MVCKGYCKEERKGFMTAPFSIVFFFCLFVCFRFLLNNPFCTEVASMLCNEYI